MLLVKDDHLSSGDGVNEATAALKGLLGIGGDSSSSVSHHPTDTSTKKDGGKGKKKKGNKNKSPARSGEPGSGRKGKKKNEKKKKQPSQKENFAWSAFQALPDASALPLPTFSPADNTKAVNEKAKNVDSDVLSKLLSAIDHRASSSVAATAINSIDMTNAPRAEDLEAKVIAEAARAAETASIQTKNKKELEVKIATEQEDVAQNTISGSGINLAALAASPSSKGNRLSESVVGGPITRHQEILSPSSSVPPFSSHNQSFSSSYHHPVHMQQQQQRQQPLTQNPYLQPPMGYVTVQVQVPQGLMPDRTMVVTSPAGYPVQIIVPEGVLPGMIIPVHVPAAHLMQSPYGNYAAAQQQAQQQQMPYDMHNQYHTQHQQQHELPPPQQKRR